VPVKRLETSSWGTGIIVDKRGYILTNAHVVVIKGTAVIQALIPKRKYLEAKIVGVDRENDLALLKVDVPPSWDLRPVKWFRGPIKAGMEVMKAGYPSAIISADVPAVARGIISSNARAFVGERSTPFGVTDTQTSSGDSGGPFFNKKGEVVGTQALVSFSKTMPIGIAHFTPSGIILRTLPRLFRGNVRTGWLGFVPANCINISDLKQDDLLLERAKEFLKKNNAEMPNIEKVQAGAMIVWIDDLKAGDARLLHIGDIVTHMNGQEPQDKRELIQWIAETEPDSEILLRIVRQGTPMFMHLKVAEFKWDDPYEKPNQ
jgi:S1-C subfamily serine protease